MATFLTGVQDLARECDQSQSPSAVTGNTGILNRLVNWYADAYTELQNRYNWRWLKHEFTLTTTANDDSYTYANCTDLTTSATISRFGSWAIDDPEDPPKIYLQSAGVGTETFLIFLPWVHFKQLYKLGTVPASYPQHISIDPQNNIRIGPKPNGTYVITSEYYRSPQVLAANSDTPEMPARFHRLIVYEAILHYGYDRVAAEVVDRADRMGKRMWIDLLHDQGETFLLGGPLA